MAKKRIKNNIRKWVVKNIPFLTLGLFIWFNIPFFVHNLSSHKITLQSRHGSGNYVNMGFAYVQAIPEREFVVNSIETYKLQNGEFPENLLQLSRPITPKNWIYTKLSEGYTLAFKP